ncbi:MAG: alpha/beta fold hydrolase [Candidatus Saccharimonadales bacterium]
MPLVRVDDINLYYEVRGEGSPLVLILGLGSDMSEYGSIIDPLAEHFRVIAFDNRGAGRTDKPTSSYSINMMSEDVAGLIKKLGLKQTDVVGISMGGKIALALTLNHPDLVKNLVLACANSSSGKRVKMSLPMRLMYPLHFLPLLKGKYPQPSYAFKLQRSATLDFDVTQRLPEIKARTVILHGRKDRSAPFERAEVLHKNIKGSKLVPFKGGHLFFAMGERLEFIAAIQKFLSSSE